MSRFASVATLALLVGCGGVSESTFQDQFVTKTCAWLVDCYQSYSDVNACAADLNANMGDTSACTYDKKQAKKCLDVFDTLTCDQSAFTDYANACTGVYSCPNDTGTSG